MQGWNGAGGGGNGGGGLLGSLDQPRFPQGAAYFDNNNNGPIQLGTSQRRTRGRSNAQTIQSDGVVLPEFGRLMELMNGAIEPECCEPTCCEPQGWETVGGPGSIQPFATNLSLVISQTEAVHEQRDAFNGDAEEAARFIRRLLGATGYWNPSVVTNKNGKATVKFRVPDRSTAWKFVARGVTVGTLGGDATAELITSKPLFGELKTPAAFVDGDSTQIGVVIHNDAIDKGEINVVLKTVIAGKTLTERKTVKVDSKGLRDLSFDRKIVGAGQATFELSLTAGAFKDSTKSVIPIRPHGVPVYAATGGAADADATVWIQPPKGMDLKGPSLRIVVGPSVEQSLLDVVLGNSIESKLFNDSLLFCGSSLERANGNLLASLGLLRWMRTIEGRPEAEAATLNNSVRSAVS
ncbi:MAG: hypothetical protein N2C14_03680, partial [Planctomycetales bacterium]